MRVGEQTSEKGARSLAYLRGELEFMRKQKEFTHSLVFIGEKMNTVRRIVEILFEDSRMPLTEISKRTGIPVSTVYDNIRRLREQFRFTIVPKSIATDTDMVVFEAGQTRMYDFKPSLRAS